MIEALQPSKNGNDNPDRGDAQAQDGCDHSPHTIDRWHGRCARYQCIELAFNPLYYLGGGICRRVCHAASLSDPMKAMRYDTQ